MFLIRQATIDDGPALLKLAKLVHFINLPADAVSGSDYRLHLSYNYNAVLTFSQGTCDYVV